MDQKMTLVDIIKLIYKRRKLIIIANSMIRNDVDWNPSHEKLA